MKECWNLTGIDWIDYIRCEHVLTKECISSLEFCRDTGGYVSGGFATELARAILTRDGTLKIFDKNCQIQMNELWLLNNLRVKTLIRHGAYVKSSADELKNTQSQKAIRFWKIGVTDVDVFFPGVDSANSALQKIENEVVTIDMIPSLAKYATEVIVGSTTNANILQVITSFTGQPADVLGQFDLANPRVYFDSAGLHWTDDWADLEERRLLGIDRTDKQNLLWRASKWFHDHKYVDFRKGDHEKLFDVIMSAVELSKSGKLKRFGNDVNVYSIKSLFKRFWHVMPAKILLMSSFMCDTYETKELYKKIGRQCGTLSTSGREGDFVQNEDVRQTHDSRV